MLFRRGIFPVCFAHRFVTFDMLFKFRFEFFILTDNVLRPKTVFVQWAPMDTTRVKDRMICSMFSKGIEKQLEDLGAGGFVRIEAGGVDGLDFAEVEAKLRNRSTVK
jgi:hypothetical protein